MKIFKCEVCNGEGGWQDWVECWKLPYQTCPNCKGTGKIGFWAWFWYHAPEWYVDWYIGWKHGEEYD